MSIDANSATTAISLEMDYLIVVLVGEEDELSQYVRTALQNMSLQVLFVKEQCALLELSPGSEQAKLFHEIYRYFEIPSLFIINKIGVPVDIVTFNERFRTPTATHADIVDHILFNMNLIMSNDKLLRSLSDTSVNDEDQSCPILNNLDTENKDDSEENDSEENDSEENDSEENDSDDEEIDYEIEDENRHSDGGAISRSAVERNHISVDATIKFILPNQENLTLVFSNDQTLHEVMAYLKDFINLQRFIFLRSYPRLPYTEEEYNSNLIDLRLYPNGVIFVQPVALYNVSNLSVSMGHLTSLVKYVLTPVTTLLNMVVNFVTNVFARTPVLAREGPRFSSRDQPFTPPREPTARSLRGRRRLNIHTLHDNTSSEEENNTYNGNSTQHQN